MIISHTFIPKRSIVNVFGALIISFLCLSAVAQNGKPLTSPVTYNPDADMTIWLDKMQEPNANF